MSMQEPKVTVQTVSSDIKLVKAAKNTDIIFVTKMKEMRLNHYARVLDQSMGGLISRLSQSFEADSGNFVGLDLSAEGVEFGRVKYVYLVGLGSVEEFSDRPLCAFIGFVLKQAVLRGARKVTLLEPPHRLTGLGLSLRRTGSVLACRCHEFAQHEQPGQTLEVQVLCSPQAKRRLEEGAEVTTQQCFTCPLPTVYYTLNDKVGAKEASTQDE